MACARFTVLMPCVKKLPVPESVATVPVTSNAPDTVTLPAPVSVPPVMVRLVKVVSSATSSVPPSMMVGPV